jgi:hypothetical protein
LCSQEWAPWHVSSVLLSKPPDGAPLEPLIDDVQRAAQQLAQANSMLRRSG